MIEIQTTMAERALELLLLPEQPCLLLDVGCGSGISGEAITEAGHMWVGYDISASMLKVAHDREVDGDLILCDAGQGLKLRPGSFDGAISISALQWLCNIDKRGHVPFQRLKQFFTTLYSCLRQGARAVLQFYPETASQVEMITSAALRCGFGGGLVVDYPHSTKAKKHFLVIYAGYSGDMPPVIPLGLQDEVDEHNNTIRTEARERGKRKGKNERSVKDKIIAKKDAQRRGGMEVRKDTKYTARARKSKGGF
jgi:18S rRNA (guanine1575-N7)-methyltransferase